MDYANTMEHLWMKCLLCIRIYVNCGSELYASFKKYHDESSITNPQLIDKKKNRPKVVIILAEGHVFYIQVLSSRTYTLSEQTQGAMTAELKYQKQGRDGEKALECRNRGNTD